MQTEDNAFKIRIVINLHALSQQIKQLYKDTVLEVLLLLINMLSFSAAKAVIQRHCIRGILTVY